jgi:hypothetical protein
VKPLPFFLLLNFLTSVFSVSQITHAGTVTKKSDKGVIIDFADEEVPAPNDRVFILDQNTHKEVGLVKIIKTKNSRALGKLLKGKANPGDKTDLAPADPESDENREPAEETNMVQTTTRNSKNHISRISYGIGADYVYTYVYLKTELGEGSVSGSGFGLRGAIDAPLSADYALFSSVSLHPLTFSDEANGVPTTTTTYMALDVIGRYIFDKRHEGIWLGGGLGYYLPISSDIKPKPTSEITLIGCAGFNLRLSRDYLTLKTDFVMYPNKNSNGQSTQAFQFVLGGVYFF